MKLLRFILVYICILNYSHAASESEDIEDIEDFKSDHFPEYKKKVFKPFPFTKIYSKLRKKYQYLKNNKCFLMYSKECLKIVDDYITDLIKDDEDDENIISDLSKKAAYIEEALLYRLNSKSYYSETYNLNNIFFWSSVVYQSKYGSSYLSSITKNVLKNPQSSDKEISFEFIQKLINACNNVKHKETQKTKPIKKPKF